MEEKTAKVVDTTVKEGKAIVKTYEKFNTYSLSRACKIWCQIHSVNSRNKEEKAEFERYCTERNIPLDRIRKYTNLWSNPAFLVKLVNLVAAQIDGIHVVNRLKIADYKNSVKQAAAGKTIPVSENEAVKGKFFKPFGVNVEKEAILAPTNSSLYDTFTEELKDAKILVMETEDFTKEYIYVRASYTNSYLTKVVCYYLDAKNQIVIDRLLGMTKKEETKKEETKKEETKKEEKAAA